MARLTVGVRLLLIVVIVAFANIALFAQQSHSDLRVMVVDTTGAPIQDARVEVIQAGKTLASTNTDQNGGFTLPLPAGLYSVSVKKEGFADQTEEINLPQDTSFRKITLKVGSLPSVVTVVADENYTAPLISSATKTQTPLRDVPQSIAVVTQAQIQDQMLVNIGDLMRYVPGITAIQGENNRDQLVIRGNSTSADFFLDGIRDDVQYYRDLYNLDRVEVLKGPNAMEFGRGGGGGVINRSTKEAGFQPVRELTLQGGSYSDRRFTGDFDQPVNDKLALRLNGMYEDSDSFRNYVGLERYAFNPTLTYQPSEKTRFALGYENLHDHRVADRGVPSFAGLPANVPESLYFGDPNASWVRAIVNIGSAAFDQQIGPVSLNNRTMVGNYDRGYQNFVPGVVTTDQTKDSISAYNNATYRRNLFNQTNAVFQLSTGKIHHTFVAGAEFGRQWTDNFRNTGFFNNTATSLLVPMQSPLVTVPVTFRQAATDADNHLDTVTAATYIQDQVDLTRKVKLIGGLRFDRFDLQFHNNRTAENFQRTDDLASPRLGIVVKPIPVISVYGSYSVSYLPSSGDQFSSLTSITQQVKPEKFNNYEAGLKWDLTRYLSLTSAVYRLDRTNTRSTDPNDPTRIVQTGSQRTNGFEAAVTGSLTKAWKVAGGYSYQDAFVTSATASAVAGAQVAQVPHHNFSLWNNYQIIPRLGAGLGLVSRSNMFAAIDNTVVLPSYTRVDAAIYYSVTEKIRVQANIENLGNIGYILNADNNNNISPGSPIAVRVGLTAHF